MILPVVVAVFLVWSCYFGKASSVWTLALSIQENFIIDGNNDDAHYRIDVDVNRTSHSNNHQSSDDGMNDFFIGTGIYDITGPIAQVNFMGYADPQQTGHGIHQRLRARAYIISERYESLSNYHVNDNNHGSDGAFLDVSIGGKIAKSRKRILRKNENKIKTTSNNSANPWTIDPNKTICFVSIDLGMGSDWINHQVVRRLKDLQNSSEIDAASQSIPCTIENLSISGTHTHSGPSGFLQYFLYQVTSGGSNRASVDTVVNGIVQALIRAKENLQLGSIQSVHGPLLYGASINRSPSSYLLNPESERTRHIKDGGDTDKDMHQLNFRAEDGTPTGVISWFAVHCTSMNKTNTLVSGDNKGYASYLMEKHFNGNETFPGTGPMIAAFVSSNAGDVSPNVAGPRCIDSGRPCHALTSSCNSRNTELCIASGPGKTMKHSTEIIGRKQFDHSLKLWNVDSRWNSVVENRGPANKTTSDQLLEFMLLSGPVRFRHSFVDMSAVSIVLNQSNGSESVFHTCPPALGYSFAAGTTDGPGECPFYQGMNRSVSSSAFKQFLTMTSRLFAKPSPEQTACHHPKPILFDVGHFSTPYAWVPHIVPLSIFQIGKFYLLNCPGEFTTMAGRRLKNSIRETLISNGVQNPHVVIAGLSNSYTHYVTTYEEYQAQRYEAASTLYGPHTLSAYIQEFTRITNDLLLDAPSQTKAVPNDLTTRQISLLPQNVLDTIGIGYSFGSVVVDADDQYRLGDTVSVTFRSSNPRNNYKTEDTYLTVEKMNETDGTWQKIYVDGDWCTELHWNQRLGSMSFARVVWEIPPATAAGLYRVCHFGTRKRVIGEGLYFLFNVPLWMTANSVLTSRVADVIYQILRMILKYTGTQKTLNHDWIEALRTRDFQGCSRSFLVHP